MQIFILGIRRESTLRHYESHKSPHAYQFLQVTAGERRGPARPAPLHHVVTVRRDEQEGEGLQAAAAEANERGEEKDATATPSAVVTWWRVRPVKTGDRGVAPRPPEAGTVKPHTWNQLQSNKKPDVST